MSAVRNLINDLVDRRLWPVAVALLGALVAVPMLLGGGPKAPAPAPAAPLAAAPAGGTTQAAISAAAATTTTTPQYRPGPVRNPFAQHKVPAPATTTPVSPAPAAGVPASSAPVTGAPVGGTLPVTPIVPNSGGVQHDNTVTDIWRVNLRFGEAGDQKMRHDIPRLTPLPSATNPFFIFLGVLSDHKTAVFLISSDATATGDGTCKPSPTQCDQIEMRAGDTEFFDVADGNAGVTQYELDLTKVFKSTVQGKAAAAKASRVSSDGKNVLDELKADGQPIGYGRYIWSAKRGVLVRRHHLSAKATASSSGTGSTPAAQMSQVFGVTWTG
jgi:hypothetical protein